MIFRKLLETRSGGQNPISVTIEELVLNQENPKIDGYCFRLPILNEMFVWYSQESNGEIKTLRTTKVVEIDSIGNVLLIRTVSSKYRVVKNQ